MIGRKRNWEHFHTRKRRGSEERGEERIKLEKNCILCKEREVRFSQKIFLFLISFFKYFFSHLGNIGMDLQVVEEYLAGPQAGQRLQPFH